jgi:isopentenyl-diphosphate delta-isomerase
MEHVILVDNFDNVRGTMEKMEAHKNGELHRAFSILLFNDQGKLLLQKRSENKYHSGGLWTNTCCSHPLPGEKTEDATKRRLREEMGIDIQPTFSYKFIYKAELDSNLTEHELDHVFFGIFNGTPSVNKKEVADWKYAGIDWLTRDLAEHPDVYTVWLRLIMNNQELVDSIHFFLATNAQKH